MPVYVNVVYLHDNLVWAINRSGKTNGLSLGYFLVSYSYDEKVTGILTCHLVTFFVS